MMFIWIILTVVIIGFFIYKGSSKNKNSAFSQNNSAMETLKKRYANGEISKEEFEEKKSEI